jgi:hypothetical protein
MSKTVNKPVWARRASKVRAAADPFSLVFAKLKESALPESPRLRTAGEP